MRLGFFIKFRTLKSIIMKTLFSSILILLLTISVNAQQKKDTLTIPEKFDKIYRTSSSYQEYKVVGKTRFQDLKKEVTDSLNDLKTEINTKDQLIQTQKDSISNIKKIAETFEADYRQTLTRTSSINFMGIEFLKSSYNAMVWSIIGVILILLVYFIYKFRNSNVVTTQAKSDLQELEEEFATHKKKSLEREQKLRRQLQDEINKQRGV